MVKKILLAGILGVLVIGGGFAVVRFLDDRDDAAAAARPAAPTVATAEVVRTDLSDYWTETGTVGYRRQRTLRGVAAGVLTWLPKSGRTLDRGDTIYRVGDRPVSLFYGSAPLFRDIGTVGLVGPDVRTVADNLRALGYSVGQQPAPGTEVTLPGAGAGDKTGYQVTLTEKDGVFTAALKDAVQRWQTDKGLRPATGTVTLGDILVLTGAVRVGAAAAQLGDDATGNLMAISDEAKAVTVDVDASRADDIRAGQKVQITLPDSTKTGGTVRTVSTKVQPSTAEAGTEEPKVQVVVGVDKASAIKNISSADVEVRFTGTTRSGVLAVPVGALLALRDGGYGVQLSGGALTAVEVGMFADGMVQVTGAGVTAGARVVTTAS
ncbi:peptidoglycan-binding protein [Actinoplanes couchii]|uniref:Peptidoglycan-binding protein n=1 Tax=Actinoplanes couchii TaxID=403638 RepID=A0ABQ3XTL0_9ACTN|nr:peptidoglycan-binding protein [Actinoplanes couchii]MDR6318957.1 peptidoglycan hydrolase-like protein with peptidoglycan-binding domain [Actinoplanes couchii]GID61805.1 peptidoglycan-binding protein [Actinoplanes couchii]